MEISYDIIIQMNMEKTIINMENITISADNVLARHCDYNAQKDAWETQAISLLGVLQSQTTMSLNLR